MQVRTKIISAIYASYSDDIRVYKQVNDFIADKDFVNVEYSAIPINSPMDCIRYTAFITYQESR
ncbi:hypothetical protein DIX60_10095 [Streptococcus iniae]|nr:hypothetical protein BKX95_02215 [Streptococcus iniae]RLV26828.1 hypothetical protein DIX60_10095 [Streptococcus iniae]